MAYLVDLELPEPGTRCPAVTSGDGSGVGNITDQLLEQMTAAGIPEPVAACIVDRLTDELGETGLEDLLLGGDPDALTEKVTGITTQCMAEN